MNATARINSNWGILICGGHKNVNAVTNSTERHLQNSYGTTCQTNKMTRLTRHSGHYN